MGTEGIQVGGEVGDEGQGRLLDLVHVAGPIGLEPGPVVVGLQLGEELEQGGREVGGRHRLRLVPATRSPPGNGV